MELSLRAFLDRGRLHQEALGDGVREVIVFSSRGGRVGYVSSLQDELRRMLTRHGLYPKEAAAMVATWGDSWFEEGTRIFYVLLCPLVDRAPPLTVTPPPSETLRVLVGRLELVLPQDIERARGELDRLSDPPTADELRDARERLGRFGEPTLRRLAARRTDPSTRRRPRRCSLPSGVISLPTSGGTRRCL